MDKIAYNEHVFDNGLRIDMKKYDRLKKNFTWIVAGSILGFAFLLLVIVQVFMVDSDQVVVLIDGKEQGIYSLGENAEVRVETDYGYNVLTIKDGQAYVSEADCENQVCAHTQPIGRAGGQIVCLPHRVVIRLKTTEKSEIDAVTN